MIKIPCIFGFLTDFVGNQPMHDQGYKGQQNGHQEVDPYVEQQQYSDEVDRHEQEIYHQEQLQQEQQIHKMNGEPEMPETEQVST